MEKHQTLGGGEANTEANLRPQKKNALTRQHPLIHPLSVVVVRNPKMTGKSKREDEEEKMHEAKKRSPRVFATELFVGERSHSVCIHDVQ